MTLLIRGGRVLDSKRMEFFAADVLIEDGKIASVSPAADARAGVQELDASGHYVLPGLVNGHTHSMASLARGLANNSTLEDLWVYGPANYGIRTQDDHYVSAALGAVEMLRTGCTAAYDMVLVFPTPTDEAMEAIVQAYTDVGLRVVLAPTVGDVPFVETLPNLAEFLPESVARRLKKVSASPTSNLLKFMADFIQRWDGAANGRIRAAVSPVIPGHCSDSFLLGCQRLVRDYGVGLQTHIAETKVQAVNAMHRWGQSMISQLDDMGLLGPQFVGGHGVWLTPEDIRRLADRGCTLVSLPASNLKLGSGIAPLREMLEEGLTVGLGTDGSVSSDNQNMFEAMRFAALLSKVRFPYQQDMWVGARAVWEMATKGSLRALGITEGAGAIAPGSPADVILLNCDSVFLNPFNQAANSLVYAETGASVVTTIIDGRIVFHEGEVRGVAEEELVSRAQEAAERLRFEGRKERILADQLRPYVAAACQALAKSSYPVNRYAR